MLRNVFFAVMCLAASLIAGCNQPTSTTPDQAKQEMWNEKLAAYSGQIDQVKAEMEGVQDLTQLFGSGSGDVHGDGTFIGEGVGTATLTGVGIVTGEVIGEIKVRGTADISTSGLVYVGNKDGYEAYSGTGYFTTTSDVGQEIEVVTEGDCWVVGAGTGMVFWSGEGWVFWYR